VATFAKKPKQLPLKFTKKTAREVTDLPTLVLERDGPPLRPNQYNDPYHHTRPLGTCEAEVNIDEGDRRYRYKWIVTVHTCFTTVKMLEHFGEVWTHMGDFHFNGQCHWAALKFRHYAELMGGAPALTRLADQVDALSKKV
jgi:hypothetical protein